MKTRSGGKQKSIQAKGGLSIIVVEIQYDQQLLDLCKIYSTVLLLSHNLHTFE